MTMKFMGNHDDKVALKSFKTDDGLELSIKCSSVDPASQSKSGRSGFRESRQSSCPFEEDDWVSLPDTGMDMISAAGKSSHPFR